MNHDFDILHLSYRESDPDSEYKWLKVNIVFKVTDELNGQLCDNYSSAWTKTFIWEVDDPARIDQYFLHTRMEWEDDDDLEKGHKKLAGFRTDPQYDISYTKKHGWSINNFEFLKKIEKFNVYRFHDYIEDNSITRSALLMLEGLKNGEDTGSRFVSFSTLTRCLMVLHLFWD